MRLREDVSTASTEYGMILLDERTGRYWQLSPVAALVVEQWELGKDPTQTVNSVTDRFEVDVGQAQCDIDAFAATLRAAGLVTG